MSGDAKAKFRKVMFDVLGQYVSGTLVTVAADKLVTALLTRGPDNPGWLIEGDEVHEIIETDFKDSNGEYATYEVYTVRRWHEEDPED